MTVRLIPTGLAFIPGVPAVEQDASEEQAAEWLSYEPPAFTIEQGPDPSPPPKAGKAMRPVDDDEPPVSLVGKE